MKVFIAGASGLVGNNCYRHFKDKGWEVVGSYFSYPTKDTVYFNTLDLNNLDNFDVMGFQPDAIVHCGALTHVDYCETHEAESYEKTVQSTINLLSIARQTKTKFVYISTDYVFDGEKGPYKEEDAVNPMSVYGKHKLKAEELVQEAGVDYLILRITNVYGDEERGKNFIARIIDQCKNKQHLNLKLPVDQFATPCNAWDIARAMFVLLNDNKTGVYHICSTDLMNRVDLALRVLQYFPDASYDLQPFTTKELNQAAPRPLIGGFVKTKFSNEYPEFLFSNVDDYLKTKTP